MYGMCRPDCGCDDCNEQLGKYQSQHFSSGWMAPPGLISLQMAEAANNGLGDIDWGNVISEVGNVTTRVITAINPQPLPAYAPPYTRATTAPVYQQAPSIMPTQSAGMGSLLPWAAVGVGLLVLSGGGRRSRGR